MGKKTEVINIWRECFPGDSVLWRRMFFDAVYVDDEALTIEDPQTGLTVSSLLLLSYSMTFHGHNVGLGYIYGAGTLKKFRARGFMSTLLRKALREASDRGDTFAALIPATDSLRRYYGKFGFATVFYSRPERYTSIHRFPYSENYTQTGADSPALYEAFERMMSLRPCCVQHSRAQFLTLMDDARLCGHGFAAVSDAATGRVRAMVWAVPEVASNVLRIRELLADSDDSANAVLSALTSKYPQRPLTIMARPSNDVAGGNLTAGGMARVVNAESALRIVAAKHPSTRLLIRLTDPLLPENSGLYTLNCGSLSVNYDTTEDNNSPKPDLDINPEVLTAMLFSSTPVAAITGLPAMRPCMTLMLD